MSFEEAKIPEREAKKLGHKLDSDDSEKALQAVLHGQTIDALDEEALRLSSAEEKKLLRRIDWWIVPYPSLLFLLSFLDRVNIGQARLAGLEKDLRLRGHQYDIALTIFFVSYVAFELPSNLVLKKLKPQRWICFLMISWSIVQICMGLVTGYKSLYAARWLLGMFEAIYIFRPISTRGLSIFQAGLFPGLNFLFTTWYTRTELNQRVSIFFAGSTLAGAFGGLLAFGIRHMAGIGHKDGWAWIFIIEGLLTLVCAIPSIWLVQDFPQYSNILNTQERAKWLHRLTKSQGVTNAPLPFTKEQVIRGLTDWKTYVYSIIYLSIAQPFYSLSLFVPTIIAALGYTNAKANLLSAAPYALGTATTLLTAYISDRLAMRAPVIIVMMILSIAGYIILLCNVSPGVKYVAVFITVAGVNPCICTAITLCGNNFGPMYTRATVMGIFFSFGNSAGLISSNVYPIGDAPRYIRGHSVAIAFSGLAIALCAFMAIYNRRENSRRDRLYGVPSLDGSDCSPLNAGDPVLLKRWGLEGKSMQEIIELGDRHPAFRYII